MVPMTRARAVVAVFLFVAAGLVAASPSRAALLSELPHVVFVTLLATVAAEGMSRFVLGYPSQRGGAYPPRAVRLMVVASAALVMLCLVSFEASAHPHRPWLAELGHLAVLAGAGVALARWCGSSEQSPLYLATGLAVFLSASAALRSTSITEGIPHAARVLMKLPEDVAVLWAAWHVAAIRGRAETRGLERR